MSYEYKLVATVLIFYYMLFFLVGYLGIPTAYELSYDDPNVFDGVRATFDKPFESEGVAYTLFFILLTLPLWTIGSMMVLNYIKGR